LGTLTINPVKPGLKSDQKEILSAVAFNLERAAPAVKPKPACCLYLTQN
jgi:hypothetical protein